jgi:hypothetical protein
MALLDNHGAMQMIIDGYGIKEIESTASATKEAEAIQALTTFGDNEPTTNRNTK